MESLTSILTSAGLAEVRAIIASGNVLFESGRGNVVTYERKIEKALRAGLGYDVDTFVRSMDEIKRIAGSANVKEASARGWNLHITFLKEPATAAVAKAFATLETPDDLFRVDGREIYWIRNGRMTDSEVKEKHLKEALGKQTNTVRNHNTILRIVEKFG
jgi:uncharacterized protein (DUF1697 family)